MSKVFGKNNGRPNRVKRNPVDLSFQNNGTFKFGAIYPVMTKEVLPGDTFDFDITCGLRAMPMVFPVQTRMRVDFHAFYVRNRNLWKDWPDFIGQTKTGLVSPTIGASQQKEIRTGSLSDYLGLSTTIVGNLPISSPAPTLGSALVSGFCSPLSLLPGRSFSVPLVSSSATLTEASPVSYIVLSTVSSDALLDVVQYLVSTVSGSTYDYLKIPSSIQSGSSTVISDLAGEVGISSLTVSYGLYSPSKRTFYPASIQVSSTDSDSNSFPWRFEPATFRRWSNPVNFTTISDAELACFCCVDFVKPSDAPSPSTSLSYSSFSFGSSFLFPFVYQQTNPDIVDFVDVDGVVNPYSVEGDIPSALPYRAYESIYNAFYRDDRNNPLILNGQKEYNKYLPTTEGGVDDNVYSLHYRNWEQDQFTTALPSPQQGVAPLVGISSTGVVTFQDVETGQMYQVQAETADDADTIVNFNVRENVPNSVARSLVNYATSGISINDFRNVNAYQRWLETNIRRGLKYRDQIKSHYDVDVSYQELDMPEFVGGTSIPININTVSQTSESSITSSGQWSSALGSYAGQAFAVGQSKHRIRKYCDEHGFLMVLMSIVPVPNYPQITPKFFYKKDPLDYFFPEFGHIGLQAIPTKELSAVQAAQSGELNKTFGYQRPWYDYLSSLDEVHGLMRTSLRNFVLNRVFDNVPTLSEDFLLVNPKHLNDVFAVQDDSDDKFMGQIYFTSHARRPIPMYGVPRLESNL